MSTQTPNRFNTREPRSHSTLGDRLALWLHSPNIWRSTCTAVPTGRSRRWLRWPNGATGTRASWPARADVLHDIRDQHFAIAENNQDAVSLLDLAGRAQ